MAAFAFNGQVDLIGGGHVFARLHADFPGFERGKHMLSEHLLWGGIFQNARFDHHGSASRKFLLRGLEDQFDAAFKVIFQIIQDTGRPQQAGHVHIVTAGVHHSGVLGAVVDLVFFIYGQGIHIGPECNHLFARISAFDQAHNAMHRHAGCERNPVSGKFCLNKCRCFLFLHRKFGVHVQVSPDVLQFRF
ncbi:hypothetical protein DSECCO2_326770 [anaerobic digester metagenome]